MLAALTDSLAWLGTFSDALAWLVVIAFVATALLEYADRTIARRVGVAAWGLFGAFWATMIHHYLFEAKSIIEGLGTLAAVPLSIYVAYLLWDGRDSLFVLTRAVAIMGAIFLPVELIPVFRRTLIEVVTVQTGMLMSAVGMDYGITGGMTVEGWEIAKKQYPYESTFVFHPDGHLVTYTIRIACTGLGSIAIFAGLIGAVRAPWRKKARALAIAVPVIYGLNLVRNVFIAWALGTQSMHLLPDLVMAGFGVTDPYLVSWLVADRLFAQLGSVIALVALTWLVVRQLPEVVTVVEDALFLVTGSEYDLRTAFAIEPEAAD
jgi:archaeosortase A (PGF-CTERM-specific)